MLNNNQKWISNINFGNSWSKALLVDYETFILSVIGSFTYPKMLLKSHVHLFFAIEMKCEVKSKIFADMYLFIFFFQEQAAEHHLNNVSISFSTPPPPKSPTSFSHQFILLSPWEESVSIYCNAYTNQTYVTCKRVHAFPHRPDHHNA